MILSPHPEKNIKTTNYMIYLGVSQHGSGTYRTLIHHI